MNPREVDLTEFKKAISSFQAALLAEKNDLTRDATIQRFEFCIELAWKSAKKVLGLLSGAPKTIVREMGKDGLIEDVDVWLNYIELRNLSTHTYQELLAEKVYQACPLFLLDVKKLLDKMQSRIT